MIANDPVLLRQEYAKALLADVTSDSWTEYAACDAGDCCANLRLVRSDTNALMAAAWTLHVGGVAQLAQRREGGRVLYLIKLVKKP